MLLSSSSSFGNMALAVLFVVGFSNLLCISHAFGFRPAILSLVPNKFHLASLTTPQEETASSIDKPVPMTLLAGFLGTGKTTTLQHLLENTEDYKIGVIVNDVADVNIDAKLVSKSSNDAQVGADGIVQLENGCACCSLADELFFSVEKLMMGRDLDAIVVELSGVADPIAIVNNWKMAPLEIRQQANITQVVTVIDAQTFGSDYMTWDMVTDRRGWSNDPTGCSNQKVSELLAEQVEAAHLILLNKVDLAGEEQVQVASKVASALNKKASITQSEFGKVLPSQLLGARAFGLEEEESGSHSHDHDCTDAATCTDPSHSHSHDHHDSATTSSSHSHSHEHSDSSECGDPTCTDESHSHSHSHATSTEALGISNFVYKATKPFSTQRLLKLLNRWPIPKKEVLDLGFWQDRQDEDMFGNSVSENPFVGVLRVKGFCWFGPSQWVGMLEDAWRHDTAMYMSHAGRHMSVNAAGKWWDTIPKENLPKFFDEGNEAELQRILREDFVTEEFGDRRQELVFIGVDIDEPAIRVALDECLLSADEMETYREDLANFRVASSTSN
mmetsp:Transcript_16804/g.38654  ORF Transcript_16804/g.38654 Transcript_16804/m.38654 type:complete len:558 (+) Transcript_16804:96-1769(+)